jgi:carbonic anhydrase
MPTDHDVGPCCNVGRRKLLALAALAGAGAAFAPDEARAAALTKQQRDALTPDEALRKVMQGNERFVTAQRRARDFLAEQRESAEEGQHPFIVFLTCIDSRAPVEIICDLGIGDAFNARVAGNAVNDDILGSMEFATAAAGAKLVMVMGHTACGAIKGAIDNVRLGNLTLLLARFGNAIAETEFNGEKSSKNAAYVDAVATTHVRRTVALIRERSPVMRDLEDKGRIRIVGSMYDLAAGRVTLV